MRFSDFCQGMYSMQLLILEEGHFHEASVIDTPLPHRSRAELEPSGPVKLNKFKTEIHELNHSFSH